MKRLGVRWALVVLGMAATTGVSRGDFFTPGGGAATQAGSGGEAAEPAAARALDRTDLVEKLTGAGDAGDAGDTGGGKLKAVAARMQQSSARLAGRDPGAVTQEVQGRIVRDLDALIDLLKKQERNGGGSGSAASRPAEAVKPGERAGKATGMGGDGATNAEERAGETVTPPIPTILRELRNSGMNLPPRDRQAITTGITHGVLPAYRDQVARYYRVLAEMKR